MTGNAPAASAKRAVGRCDTVGRPMRSHPQAAHRTESLGFARVGKDGLPPLEGYKRAQKASSRQAEWYRGNIRLCSCRDGFLF